MVKDKPIINEQTIKPGQVFLVKSAFDDAVYDKITILEVQKNGGLKVRTNGGITMYSIVTLQFLNLEQIK